MSMYRGNENKETDSSDPKLDLDPLLSSSHTRRNYSTISGKRSGSTSTNISGSGSDIKQHRITSCPIKHRTREPHGNSSRSAKFVGRVLQYIQPYMGFVTKMYYALLFNVVFISILFVASSIKQSNNGLFGYNIVTSNSPPLLVAANIIMMISYSVQSYVILRVCLSCGKFISLIFFSFCSRL